MLTLRLLLLQKEQVLLLLWKFYTPFHSILSSFERQQTMLPSLVKLLPFKDTIPYTIIIKCTTFFFLCGTSWWITYGNFKAIHMEKIGQVFFKTQFAYGCIRLFYHPNFFMLSTTSSLKVFHGETFSKCKHMRHWPTFPSSSWNL